MDVYEIQLTQAVGITIYHEKPAHERPFLTGVLDVNGIDKETKTVQLTPFSNLETKVIMLSLELVEMWMQSCQDEMKAVHKACAETVVKFNLGGDDES